MYSVGYVPQQPSSAFSVFLHRKLDIVSLFSLCLCRFSSPFFQALAYLNKYPNQKEYVAYIIERCQGIEVWKNQFIWNGYLMCCSVGNILFDGLFLSARCPLIFYDVTSENFGLLGEVLAVSVERKNTNGHRDTKEPAGAAVQSSFEMARCEQVCLVVLKVESGRKGDSINEQQKEKRSRLSKRRG